MKKEEILYKDHKKNMEAVMRSHAFIFDVLTHKNRASPELMREYVLFCETAYIIFEKDPHNFRFDDVLVSIPKNRWMEIYLTYKSKVKLE